MINKDYILRLVEKLGRALAIIMGLRKFNRNEEALIYIDDLFLDSLGFTSSFINSLPEDLLVQTFSLMGTLNIDHSLWVATLLKAEGDIYAAMGRTSESYYRYLKSLHLFLTILTQENMPPEKDLVKEVDDLNKKLEEYELPHSTERLFIAYYEKQGQYARAEDLLFELLEADNKNASELVEYGEEFYNRLLAKSDADLLAGNLSREEVEEGLIQIEQMRTV